MKAGRKPDPKTTEIAAYFGMSRGWARHLPSVSREQFARMSEDARLVLLNMIKKPVQSAPAIANPRKAKNGKRNSDN